MYITTHLLKLVDLSDEEVTIATSHFGVCDVNHVLCEMETYSDRFSLSLLLRSWQEMQHDIPEHEHHTQHQLHIIMPDIQNCVPAVR